MSKIASPPKFSRFDAASIKSGTLKIPRAALRFEAAVELGEPDEAEGDNPARVPISLRARSGDVVEHWYFGRIVHDFEGMSPASEQLPFDYCHRDDEVLGFSDSQDTSSGELVMHGSLIPFTDKDRASEVIYKAQQGFAWQGSIYFDPFVLLLEYVPEGMTSAVNGGQFQGPGVIAREWMLRGAAICPYGQDPNTSAQFSSQPGDEVAVSFQESSAMAKKTKTKLGAAKPAPNRHDRRAATALAAKKGKAKTKLATQRPVASPVKPKTKLAADDEDEDDEEEMDADDVDEDEDEGDDTETENDCDCAGEEGCECDEDEDDEDAEDPVEMDADDEDADEGKQAAGKQSAKKGKTKLTAAQQAKRFITAFGSKGGIWFAQGKSFQQAQTLFNSGLQKRNDRLQKQVTELSSQVAALGGEEEPVKFSSADEKAGRQKNGKGKAVSGLSAGAAKFAAGIKIRK